ncbi:hypothetical protein MOC97_04900 [Bacillus atrophaeus]|uniref:hypothetical protein n=1 Tax=Bacillus atrophaeus TaxID=1452 RepID=UPI0012FEE496|nr:hypothetical protein [Bacillus atrophaeus]MCY8484829.1 hypothetical protein [Bacillus atrophaeus]
MNTKWKCTKALRYVSLGKRKVINLVITHGKMSITMAVKLVTVYAGNVVHQYSNPQLTRAAK